MKKSVKWLSALAAAGAVIGLVIAYFCKRNNNVDDFEDDVFEDDDDFDLDVDLKSSSERGYVPLNKVSEKPEDTTEEASEEEVND